MMQFLTFRRLTARMAPALTALLLSHGLPAVAQYKVVQPDGSVTYTDRPPIAANVRVTPMGRHATAPAGDVALPVELRQAAQRYPVTLYTAADCVPCDNGRKLLQQRGVPYIERSIGNEDDAQALERAVGGRTVPALTIGAQQLRGLAEGDWMAYLDAAGYPRESRLPRNWPVPVASTLTERAERGQRAGAAPRPLPPSAEARPPTIDSSSGGVRF